MQAISVVAAGDAFAALLNSRFAEFTKYSVGLFDTVRHKIIALRKNRRYDDA